MEVSFSTVVCALACLFLFLSALKTVKDFVLINKGVCPYCRKILKTGNYDRSPKYDGPEKSVESRQLAYCTNCEEIVRGACPHSVELSLIRRN